MIEQTRRPTRSGIIVSPTSKGGGPPIRFTRRTCLRLAGLALCPRLASAQQSQPATRPAVNTVRDRLWIWTHPAGSCNTAPNKDEWPFTDYGFKKTSRMTPAEGALYLGVSNVVFLRYVGRPLPAELDSVARTLQPFKRVVWSVNLAAGRDGPPLFIWSTADEEEHRVISDLLKRYPNSIGLVMDDYFRSGGERRTATGADEVRAFKGTFGKTEFWDAIYTVDIENTSKEHIEMIDVVTIWTRACKDLENLEANMEKLFQRFPRARIILGCYLWDFLGEKGPIPLGLMKHQCELGLKWLKAGRIEGICFIGSPMCDMGVEAVEWTRRWIQRVGDMHL